MHAHFRLLGDKFQGGNEIEKLVAERVLRLLKRRGNRGCSDAANDESSDDVKLYKLVRYGKGAVELVDDEWAFSSEFKLCFCLCLCACVVTMLVSYYDTNITFSTCACCYCS